MKLDTFALALALGAAAAPAIAAPPTSAAAPPAPAAIAPLTALAVVPLAIPASLAAAIDAAQAACQCFGSATPWRVSPIAAPATVLSAPEVLDAIVGQDAQLPWSAAGEINPQALAVLLGSQAGLIAQISAYADPSGGGYRLGAYKWSYPTAPDYCSSETLYLMYFPRTGALFAFRFDSSSEC